MQMAEHTTDIFEAAEEATKKTIHEMTDRITRGSSVSATAATLVPVGTKLARSAIMRARSVAGGSVTT